MGLSYQPSQLRSPLRGHPLFRMDTQRHGDNIPLRARRPQHLSTRAKGIGEPYGLTLVKAEALVCMGELDIDGGEKLVGNAQGKSPSLSAILPSGRTKSTCSNQGCHSRRLAKYTTTSRTPASMVQLKCPHIQAEPFPLTTSLPPSPR
jgi:hypothetical protein